VPDPTPWIARLLVRELEGLEREFGLFPNEDLVWSVVPGISNSAGTLALHLCGNLQHYVGAVLGGSGYTRDREREFSQRGVPRAALCQEIRRTIGVVRDVLSELPEERLSLEYPEQVGGVRVKTGLFLLHLSAHLAHHVGQAGYLRRALTGDNRSAGAIAVAALAGDVPDTPA
jgi:hypothetical protein